MIHKTLVDNLMDMSTIHIIPIRDMNRYNTYIKHVETLCPPFDVIYTCNKVLAQLSEEAGYKVEFPIVYYSGSLKDGRMNATRIRQILKDKRDYDLIPGLPKTVKGILKDIKAIERINNLSGDD